MPGTSTRKPSSRAKAAPQPVEPAVERFDLLEELAVNGGESQPIVLFGVEADVRRTFTGEEAATFHAHVARNEVREALDVITDGAGEALWEATAHLPSEVVARLLNKVIALSGLSEGELRPLSPPLSARMAGAVRSQAYADGMASISDKHSENSTGETADG